LWGDQSTYVDFVVAACLLMLTSTTTEQQKDQVLGGDNGRWKELLGEFEADGYLATDQGEAYVPKA
jgi:hypothetical protein